MQMQREPRRTPLYEAHLKINARMVDFAGWLLPVQFRSIVEEHRAVRTSAGAFDVSHMGQIRIAGPQSFDLLQGVVTNNLVGLGVGGAQYELLCSDEGGIVDDAYLLHSGPQEFLLVGNAVNSHKDFALLVELCDLSHLGADVDQLTGTRGAIAVQGPKAIEILNPMAEHDLTSIPLRHCMQTRLAGAEVLVARSGYTGEDGVEMFMMADDAPQVWEAVLLAGAAPCGLGSRDTLRLEASLPLYGHEIDRKVNPFEAGLGWAVKLDKGEFVGRSALQRIAAGGIRRKLVCFQMLERGIPREHYPIAKGGASIGYVTSGTYSPTFEKGIGMGYVAVEWSQPGQVLDIMIREKPVKAEVVKRPFYRRREGR